MNLAVLALLPGLLLGLSGCTQLGQATIETMGEAVTSRSAKTPVQAEVDATPFAKLWLEIPELGSAIMVLGRSVDNRRFWATSSQQVLVESDGLVIRSSGLPQNLSASRWEGFNPFAHGLHRLPQNATAARVVDWMPGYYAGVRLLTRYSRPQVTAIEINGVSTRVMYVEEHLVAEAPARFRATNYFWVDPDNGKVLRSEQQLTPEQRIRTTLLKSWWGR